MHLQQLEGQGDFGRTGHKAKRKFVRDLPVG